MKIIFLLFFEDPLTSGLILTLVWYIIRVFAPWYPFETSYRPNVILLTLTLTKKVRSLLRLNNIVLTPEETGNIRSKTKIIEIIIIKISHTKSYSYTSDKSVQIKNYGNRLRTFVVLTILSIH